MNLFRNQNLKKIKKPPPGWKRLGVCINQGASYSRTLMSLQDVLTVLILVLFFIEGSFEELLVAGFATAEAENLSGSWEIIGLGAFGQCFATGAAGGTEAGCDLSGVF